MAMSLSITVHVSCPDDQKKQGMERGVGSNPRGLKEQQSLKLTLTLPRNTEEIKEKIPEFICGHSLWCPQTTVWTLIDFLMAKKKKEWKT